MARTRRELRRSREALASNAGGARLSEDLRAELRRLRRTVAAAVDLLRWANDAAEPDARTRR